MMMMYGIDLKRWPWSKSSAHHESMYTNQEEMVKIEVNSRVKRTNLAQKMAQKQIHKANRIEMRSELIAERCTIAYIVTSSAMCTLIKLQMRKAMKQ